MSILTTSWKIYNSPSPSLLMLTATCSAVEHYPLHQRKQSKNSERNVNKIFYYSQQGFLWIIFPGIYNNGNIQKSYFRLGHINQMLITKHDIIIYISIIENVSGITMMIMIPLTILDKVIMITGFTIKKKNPLQISQIVIICPQMPKRDANLRK